jgi:hypothetical protein
MNRWGARIMGLLMLLIFVLALVFLQKQLIAIARQRGVNTSTIK